MAAETKRLRKAKSRRAKAEKRLHKAVEAAKKNPDSKAAKKAKAAAKKALKKARTAVKHAASAKAPRKAAKKPRAKKSGKGKSRAREEAMEPAKKPRGKKKGGGKKGKRKHPDVATQITNAKMKMATIEQRYAEKLAAVKARLAKASDNEKAALIRKFEKLEQERNAELLRQQKKSAKIQADYARLQAAEEERHRKGKRRGKGKKGSKRRRNPIGSGGMKEFATAGGILTGIALTIIPYRALRSHPLLATAPSPGPQIQGQWYDQPAQGDVPNLLTAQLPVWSRMKWRGAIAMGVVVLGDIVLPLWIASRIKSHDGWKTFFQMWGMTGVTLAGTKVVVDVAALATKSTKVGNRLFAPENTSRDVRAAASQGGGLPVIAVTPGLGLPGLQSPTAGAAGYGKANEPACPHVGAGAPCCEACAASGKKANPSNPGTGQPITGTTPMPAAPGVVPREEQPGSTPVYSPTHAVGAGNISRFEPKNRFGNKRFG
ncbi:MAG: hypothetical protein KGI71_04770 [Patescibacteria group bacterium]|nr:hypothetical protein [Patescibacteria group bacterium]